jgi:hypothetical protein
LAFVFAGDRRYASVQNLPPCTVMDFRDQAVVAKSMLLLVHYKVQ